MRSTIGLASGGWAAPEAPRKEEPPPASPMTVTPPPSGLSRRSTSACSQFGVLILVDGRAPLRLWPPMPMRTFVPSWGSSLRLGDPHKQKLQCGAGGGVEAQRAISSLTLITIKTRFARSRASP